MAAPRIHVGMTARGDQRRLGRVVAVAGDVIVLERGRLRRRRFAAHTREIIRVDGDSVTFAVHRPELAEQGRSSPRRPFDTLPADP